MAGVSLFSIAQEYAQVNRFFGMEGQGTQDRRGRKLRLDEETVYLLDPARDPQAITVSRGDLALAWEG